MTKISQEKQHKTTTRKCSKCRQVKNLKLAFDKMGSSKTRYRRTCKSCTKHYVYIIQEKYHKKSRQPHTYCGYTTDPDHRLLQHQGHLSGGARRTSSMQDLSFSLVIDGYLDMEDAMRFEKKIKKARGLSNRLQYACALMKMNKWYKKSVALKDRSSTDFNFYWYVQPSDYGIQIDELETLVPILHHYLIEDDDAISNCSARVA